jgi:hypothetical protein
MFSFKEIVVEKGRIRAAQDNLQEHESCEFSQEILDIIIDEIYDDYLEYNSSPVADWNYIGYAFRGKHPLSTILLDGGTTGKGMSSFFSDFEKKLLSSLRQDGARTPDSNTRMFHMALLDSLGLGNFWLWYDAWQAGDSCYPIQKEKVKDLLLKNLEEVIIRGES